tara:strand:+ start:238 stop:633 length:396 start_codon:yes stop_codon:yes gene_type:complete
MSLLERYVDEIKEDLDLNDMNVREQQMRAPARKHFWVARMINHKRNLEYLKRDREDQISLISEAIQRKAPTLLPATTLRNKAKSHKSVSEISDNIREEELVIELLESAIKNFDSIHWVIKNIVEIMKLETM